MTLDELISAAEELRAAHGGQAQVVLPGRPMPMVRALDALTAGKIRPTAYADAEGTGARWTETVVVVRSYQPGVRDPRPTASEALRQA